MQAEYENTYHSYCQYEKWRQKAPINLPYTRFQALLALIATQEITPQSYPISISGKKALKEKQRAFYILCEIKQHLIKISKKHFEQYFVLFDLLCNYVQVLSLYDGRYTLGDNPTEKKLYTARIQADMFNNTAIETHIQTPMSKQRLDGWAHRVCRDLHDKIHSCIYYQEFHNKTGTFHLLKISRKGELSSQIPFTIVHLFVQILRLIPLTPFVGYQVMQNIRQERKEMKRKLVFNFPLEPLPAHPHNLANSEDTSSSVSTKETIDPCTLTTSPTQPLPPHLFKESNLMQQHDFFEDTQTELYTERPSRHLVAVTNAESTSIEGYYDPNKDENLPSNFHKLAFTLRHSGEENVATAIQSLYSAWDKARHKPSSASLRNSMKSRAEKLIELLVELKEKQENDTTGYVSKSVFAVAKHFIRSKISKRLDPRSPINNIKKL